MQQNAAKLLMFLQERNCGFVPSATCRKVVEKAGWLINTDFDAGGPRLHVLSPMCG